MIDLEQLLAARDQRAACQRELLKTYPGAALLCFTVQLPGAEKRNATSLTIAREGMAVLRSRFGASALQILEKDLETGFEAFFVLPLPPADLKREACEIEDTHPLGRLMDMDVIGPEGPLSRADVGLSPRRCLLCGREARYCIRARSHSVEELLARIESMVQAFI